MAYLVLSRKWRPQRFEEIIGQEHITKVLQNAINLDRVSHAYLFSGPRGVGKTTTARVLAKALNCEKGPTPTPCLKCTNCEEITKGSSLDVLEIDGASNRGIEQVRDLRENAKLKPVKSRFKVYIIDEVHMLTEPAFNALLKTLEEPPEHVKFIFATTQPNKVPLTILSRCQRFDFKPLSVSVIKDKLVQILKEEGIEFSEEAVLKIAQASEGSLRDAESLLDQLICISDRRIDIDLINECLGVIESHLLSELVQALINCDERGALIKLDKLLAQGRDASQVLEQLILYFRTLLMMKILHPADLPNYLTPASLEIMEGQANQISKEELLFITDLLIQVQERAKYSYYPRLMLEVSFLKICWRVKYQLLPELIRGMEEAKETGEPEGAKPREALASVNKKPVVEVRHEGKGERKQIGDEVPTKTEEEATPKEGKEGPPQEPKVELKDVKAIWADIVKSIEEKKMSLASFLSNAELVSVDGGILKVKVKVNSHFHTELLEDKGNKGFLQELLRERLGKEIKVEYEIEGGEGEKQSKVQQILNNPKLRRISSLLNAKILRVIPELDEGGDAQ